MAMTPAAHFLRRYSKYCTRSWNIRYMAWILVAAMSWPLGPMKRRPWNRGRQHLNLLSWKQLVYMLTSYMASKGMQIIFITYINSVLVLPNFYWFDHSTCTRMAYFDKGIHFVTDSSIYTRRTQSIPPNLHYETYGIKHFFLQSSKNPRCQIWVICTVVSCATHSMY